MVNAKITAGDVGPIAEFDGNRVALSPIPSLQNAVGKEVILGIRPEFVTIAATEVPGRVAIDVDLVETLGSEALIHASLMGEPFVIRTETLGQLDILDAVSGFTIPPHLIRVFDAETGVAFPGQVHEQ
jgi:multiple sugar transport system ATP-binding protein